VILASGTETEIITRLREVYDFLPKNSDISTKDGIVRIEIPEQVIANKLEATRCRRRLLKERSKANIKKRPASFHAYWSLIQPTSRRGATSG